jgi:hypothetical protein
MADGGTESGTGAGEIKMGLKKSGESVEKRAIKAYF